MALVISKLMNQLTAVSVPMAPPRAAMVLKNYTDLQPNITYVKNKCLLKLININNTNFISEQMAINLLQLRLSDLELERLSVMMYMDNA
jgi:hypothetical protein